MVRRAWRRGWFFVKTYFVDYMAEILGYRAVFHSIIILSKHDCKSIVCINDNSICLVLKCPSIDFSGIYFRVEYLLEISSNTENNDLFYLQYHWALATAVLFVNRFSCQSVIYLYIYVCIYFKQFKRLLKHDFQGDLSYCKMSTRLRVNTYAMVSLYNNNYRPC